jgi:hypothetical protein
VTPFHEQWERDKVVPRAVWLAAGRAGASGLGFLVPNDMIGRYLLRLCPPGQRERWLPGYHAAAMARAQSRDSDWPVSTSRS